MKSLMLLALGFTAWGQAPVTTQFGSLYCAAIQRPPAAQVQSYCYGWPGPPWVLVENQIGTLPFNLTWNSITWNFDAAGNYKFTTDGSQNVTSGTFGGSASINATQILSLACPSGLEPGGSGTCILTLNQAVLNPFDISVTVPTPLVGPSMISVLAGSSTATFSILYPSPIQAGLNDWQPGIPMIPRVLSASRGDMWSGVVVANVPEWYSIPK